MTAERAQRPANFTDILRLLGALCIIWYHNPLFWKLGVYAEDVARVKLALLGWSMPFFYIITAKHALSNAYFERARDRIKSALKIMVFYGILYELVQLSSADSIVTSCFLSDQSGKCGTLYIFDRFRTVSSSPLYYLSDVISIIILALLAKRHRLLALFIGTLICWNLIENDGRLWGFTLNPLASGCFLLALAYEHTSFLNRLFDHAGRRVWIGAGFPLITLTAWGIFNLNFAKDNLWKSPSIFFISSIFLFIVYSCDKIHVTDRKFLQHISSYGQKYSFGIFTLHQLFFTVSSSLIAKILERIAITNQLVIYICLGIFVTTLSICVTVYFHRRLPQLFRL